LRIKNQFSVQWASQQFNPDEHTAKLCWQVLRVAIFPNYQESSMTKIFKSDIENKFENKYRIPSARLSGYDYGQDGAYFVTICAKN